MADAPTSYFRYSEVLRGTGYTDQWGEYVSTGSYVALQLQEFQVIKHTPKGVRIQDYHYRGGTLETGRLICHDWNKKWACPTVEEARLSFIARKKRQARIYEARLRQAKEALQLAEDGFASTGDVHYRDRKPLPRSVPWALGSKPAWARETA